MLGGGVRPTRQRGKHRLCGNICFGQGFLWEQMLNAGWKEQLSECWNEGGSNEATKHAQTVTARNLDPPLLTFNTFCHLFNQLFSGLFRATFIKNTFWHFLLTFIQLFSGLFLVSKPTLFPPSLETFRRIVPTPTYQVFWPPDNTFLVNFQSAFLFGIHQVTLTITFNHVFIDILLNFFLGVELSVSSHLRDISTASH